MDGIVNLSLFLISSFLLIATPGPDFIYVLSRGISEGKKGALMSALGISTGMLVHTMFAALGLSAIIQASQTAFVIIKYVGATYLIYIGLKMIFASGDLNAKTKETKKKRGNIFKQGVMTNVFNPKAIVIFLAFLPQFVDVTIVNPVWQFFILGSIFTLITVIWYLFIGYFTASISYYIRQNQRIREWLKYISGLVIISLGLKLVFDKKI